jgi:2,5-dihydroxypyridine 5,6-dioxygenase
VTGMHMGGTLEYLRRPLVKIIPPGSRVLVLSDTAHDARVWQAVLGILAEIRADASLALFDPRPADYYDPPGIVCDAMLTSDFNILLTSTAMLHSKANFEAMEAGVPAMCMDGGMTLEMFQSGAVTEDAVEMERIKHDVAARVFGADALQCRVTSSYGTDFTYSVADRIVIPPAPGPDFNPYKIIDFARDERRTGSNLLFFLMPAGEFNVAPVEGSANGRLVIDLTMHRFGRLTTPIGLTVESGRIVNIDGGPEAHELRRYLAEYGDENAYMCPAEASVGINRRAMVRGNQREDKNIYGSMHFGLGTNADVGGTVYSKIHMDGVLLSPTLYVDGEVRMRDGEFLVPVGTQAAAVAA